jgi:ubiquitin-protein ligase
MRRLRNDLAALERLQAESSVFRFKAFGKPAQQFLIHMKGRSLYRVRGQVFAHEDHRIEIKLGASYPRTIPEIRWVTPIYHPNISEIGMVCLGGYGTHWVPSVQLDELCNMLWDMARYHNYDIRSPYNRDAALWVASQTKFLFPTDSRSLRDLRAALGRVESATDSVAGNQHSAPKDHANGSSGSGGAVSPLNDGGASTRVRQFMNRYTGIFAKPPEARRARAGGDVLEVTAGSDSGGGDSRGTAARMPQAEDDEIVLLESATPTESPSASGRENGDEIMFIE